MCCLTEPRDESRTESDVQGPRTIPTTLKSIFKRMSDRLVRLDLDSSILRGYSSLPSSPPSSPTSRRSSLCVSWRLQVAGLCRKPSLSDPDLATPPQTQSAPCNPVLKPVSPKDLSCPKLRSSLSPRHIPVPRYNKFKHQH